MRALHRRDVILAGGLAATAVLSRLALARPGPADWFFQDPALDADGTVAHAMATVGWSIHKVDLRIGAVLCSLHRDADAPRTLAGLTRPAMCFVIEQVARRRGMRQLAAVDPLWAFGFDGAAGAIA